MDIRFFTALFIGKLTSLMLKISGSGATAAPGLYALNIDPDFVKKFSKKIKGGSIIVSGTNGKTTTTRLIASLLKKKYRVIHNRQGSNLLRGLASIFINHSTFTGTIDADIALWEADEAVLPQIAHITNPKTVILLNLFRDQLDRYGEIESIRKSWQEMLEKLPTSTCIILNEDDPGIKYLQKFTKGNFTTFGIEDKKINLPQITNVSDVKHCPNCNSNLIFTVVFSAHIGHFECTSCQLKRSLPNIYASNLQFSKGFKTSIKLNVNKKNIPLKLTLPGLYNVYNVLAASTLAINEQINLDDIKKELEEFSSAFGRFQEFKIKNKKVIIFLIKNPAGANEVLRTISLEDNINILAILNDNIADGTDTSWVWDTNWEVLKDKIKDISVSGTRCWDLAIRIKYAEINLSKNNIYKQLNYSITATIDDLDTKDTLLIVPTYTALLQTQKYLSKISKQQKWHKN